MARSTDLSCLSGAQKDALIRDLWAMVQERDAVIADLTKRVAELEAKLGGPPKAPDNSSVPPSHGKKANNPSGKVENAKKRRRGHGRGVGRRIASAWKMVAAATQHWRAGTTEFRYA